MALQVVPLGDGWDATVWVGEVHIGAVSSLRAAALHAACGMAHDLATAMTRQPELADTLPDGAVQLLLELRRGARHVARNISLMPGSNITERAFAALMEVLR